MPTHIKTLICKQSGITLTFIDSMPDGDYSSLHAHPQLPNLHHIVEKHKGNCAKDYIAGAILHTLSSTNRLAFSKHYPRILMGQFNAALCQHDSQFLYDLYQSVLTFCYRKTLARQAQINLASITAGKWDIVKAIQALLGEGALPVVEGWQHAEKISATLMRRKNRPTLSLDEDLKPLAKSKHGADMSLKAIMARTPKILQQITRSMEKELQTAIAEDIGISIADTIYCLPNYLSLTAHARESMAAVISLCLAHGKQSGIVKSDTQKNSLEKIILLLKRTDLSPAEFNPISSADLMDDLIL